MPHHVGQETGKLARAVAVEMRSVGWGDVRLVVGASGPASVILAAGLKAAIRTSVAHWRGLHVAFGVSSASIAAGSSTGFC